MNGKPVRPRGEPVRVRTLFLRGSECRFHCTMCDSLAEYVCRVTPVGDITRQIELALSDLVDHPSPPVWLKLYNASNFFDPKNIPVEDLPTIASLVRPFQRIIVECHPRLITREKLAAFQAQCQPAQLEVAMGLECVHPDVLRKLNKQMTLEQYRDAVALCLSQRATVRSFVLLQPPWLTQSEAMVWCQASIEAARQMGVRHVSVIPVRGSAGVMAQLASSGEFSSPSAEMLENVLSHNLSLADCPGYSGSLGLG